MTAAESLGRRQTKDAIAPLIEMLHDGDMAVRGTVASALGTIGSTRATAPLVDMLEKTLGDKPKGGYTTFEWGEDADAAVEALHKITGREFAFDVSKWRRWLAEANTGK